MQIIPAMDIISGKCVRLSKGDFSSKKIYSENPVDIAKSFEDAGLTRLHMVDLDGAKAGKMANLNVLEAVAKSTDLIIDFGGGIKTLMDAKSVFNAGADIITVGSVAVKNPSLIKEMILEFGAEKLLVGADVLDGEIKISGWLEDSGVDIFVFLKRMMDIGIRTVFCTDISKDGMMEGPSLILYKEIIRRLPGLNLIASGGVSTKEDLILLSEAGCEGAIVGKAFYEGAISLEELSMLNKQIKN
ncbi:MAG: 1-(5-phosphoribosyl)-5-[(5-phosphoribosylamino)methylideneamino]imidazole-4-carboxamide isomerase [Ginsengibacter sp.]|jgi:phosphoribosylformimino-5-aminoimidazole carboxamide ribotide isomerase